MAMESYFTNQIVGNCEWYFGRQVRLIMFKKGSTTHCIVVPAESTRRSSAQCRAEDILLSSSTGGAYPLSTCNHRVMEMIADVFTVDDSGTYSIDESKLPPECLLPDEASTRLPSLQPDEATTATTSVPRFKPNPYAMQQVVTDPESSTPRAGGLAKPPTVTDPESSTARAGGLAKRPNVTEKRPNVTDSESSTPRAGGLAKPPKVTSQMPVSAAILNDADITHGPRQIAGSPVTVEDIWPFIQQIASELWRSSGYPSEPLQRLSTMTLADIQVSRDRRIATEAGSTDHSPGTILMSTPSASERGDVQDPRSPTVMTSSVHTTPEGSCTPIAGSDGAALVNREMVREEVDRAFAGAVANLARLLDGGVGRET